VIIELQLGGIFQPKPLVFWGLNNAIFLRPHPTWWIGGSKKKHVRYGISWNIHEYPHLWILMGLKTDPIRGSKWSLFFSNHSVSTKPLLKSEITSLASAG